MTVPMNDTLTAAKLVAARELKFKLRDKTFVFSTVFFLFFAVASGVVPALLSGRTTTVATADRAVAATLARHQGFKVLTVPDDAAAERAVRHGDAAAAVVAGPEVLAMRDRPDKVVQALSTSPPSRLLDPNAVNPTAAFLVPYAIAFIFFFTSLMFGVQIAQSVTEEKETRIVEILVASVPVRALLVGKVAAMTLLSFCQVTLLGIVALIGARLAGVDDGLLHLLEPAVGWFLPFYAVGFVMLAMLWAAVGALAARQQDLQGTSMPVQLTLMVPFVLVVALQGNAAAIRFLAYFPLSAPIAMPVHVFHGHAAWWEPVTALLILAATAAATLLLRSRLYEGSLLRTNGRTSWATAWKSRSAFQAECRMMSCPDL
jgi:ABC-2 type transport system permease protein